MPQISPTEFYALPLRVHTFLADVPLPDVWAVDLPALLKKIRATWNQNIWPNDSS